jgi:hypothetical protein
VLGLAPSEFWKMKPKHFWWLVETLDDNKSKSKLSDNDRRGILEAFNGNPKGDFW